MSKHVSAGETPLFPLPAPQLLSMCLACNQLMVSIHCIWLQVQHQLNISAEAIQLTDDFIKKSFRLTTILEAGHAINKPEVLFRNITEEEVEQLRDRCEV